ncbi:MAG TPA: trehalase family glycosidase, partial [Anaerolineaceae bacterium]|nr:trehalase family glycosidase [Anaerolineaceae bacterium]
EQCRLYVKLAERLTGLEPNIEAYLRRPPFIHNLAFLDENGDPLDFEVTSSPQVLFFKTKIGDFGLVFQDRRTLSIGMPDNRLSGIRFIVSPQYWQAGPQGGSFKYVRNVSYNTNGQVSSNRIVSQEDGYLVEFCVQATVDTAVTLHISPELSLDHDVLPFSTSLTTAEERWQSWFQSVPAVSSQYARTYAYAWWIMANNLVSPQGKVMYEAMMPSKTTYVGLWLWDNAMHSLAYRHINPDIARNQIRAMLAHQLPSGMLPDAIYDEGVVSSIDHPIIAQVTKPPILAWAALKLHETDPDLEFLEEIYIPLIRLNAWWISMNDDDGDGLVQYNHPYSSGLDNSPLWDYGMPVESPDINTYLCVQMGSLAVIAEHLGLLDEASMWRRKAAAIVHRMIHDFWDDEAGAFWAHNNDGRVPVMTPFNLYPLWTGQLPGHMNDRIIQHLTNPDEFWGEFALPTVARNDPHYDPNAMWRGPIWANINYFFIEALNQIGQVKLAAELRARTLEMIMRQPDIYEYYNPETGDPPDTAAPIFGWSSAVFIDLAIKASQEELEGERAI